MLIAIDSEVGGRDFFHGANPFFVTICQENGEQFFWEWPVNPLNRYVHAPLKDLVAIQQHIHDATTIVGQNLKFDVTGLQQLYKVRGLTLEWDWSKIEDTLPAGHVLASNQPHNLTDMVAHYLGRDIEPLEKHLEKAVKDGRRMVNSKYPDWRIAKEGLPEMPSVKSGKNPNNEKDKIWKNDFWLPRALATARKLPQPRPGCEHAWDKDSICIKCRGHHWWIVLSEYANADSQYTLVLWRVMRKILEQQENLPFYEARRDLMPIAQRMESRGVTLSKKRLRKLRKEFYEGSERASNVCLKIAEDMGKELTLPKGSGNNKSLLSFVFNDLKLPVVKYTDGGASSLDKYVIDEYLKNLPKTSPGYIFISSLLERRGRDKALTDMETYERFWLPLTTANGEDGWYVVHGQLNPYGTDTLRWSHSNPNESNISKKQEKCQYCDGTGKDMGETCPDCNGKGEHSLNLRYCFGPAPGREWWSLDAKNIERRIPAYEAGETEIISLFERPNDPPYFGSEHGLAGHVLYPEVFETCRNDKGELDGRIFKKRYAATYYQWTKNTNFALQYGCQEKKADVTAHLAGAYRKLKARFNKQEALNQHHIRHAEKYGYIETMPDKTVNPKRGYPLLCTRTEYGRILPTVPLAYHVSGSAMWWTAKAMMRVQAQLDAWSAKNFDSWIAMQVHDELVLDMPRRGDPIADAKREKEKGTLGLRLPTSNLWRVRKLQKLMEQGGDDLGVPTPVGLELHLDNWSEGISL